MSATTLTQIQHGICRHLFILITTLLTGLPVHGSDICDQVITQNFENFDAEWTVYDDVNGRTAWTGTLSEGHPQYGDVAYIYWYNGTQPQRWVMGVGDIGVVFNYLCLQYDFKDCTAGKWYYASGSSDTDATAICIESDPSTATPTEAPTQVPTSSPTNYLTKDPTSTPILSPTQDPTSSPIHCEDIGGQNSSRGTAESTFDTTLLDLDYYINISDIGDDEIQFYDASFAAEFLGQNITCNSSENNCVVHCGQIAGCLSSSMYIGNDDSKNQTHDVVILCDEHVSCFGAVFNTAANLEENTDITIICTAEHACNGMQITAFNFGSFHVYCNESHSCSDMVIDIHFDANQWEERNESISCTSPNACDGMRITTPSIWTTLSMFEWSDDVVLNNGYGYDGNIQCNNNRFIKYRQWINENESTITDSILSEYHSDHFPCDGVHVQCNGSSCDMEYNLNSQHISSLKNNFGDDDCYWLNVEDIQNLNCLGDCVTSPTTPPTAAPSNAPSIPTVSPTNEPTEFPSQSPSTAPTKPPSTSPTPGPTMDPTDEPTAEPTKDPTLEPTLKPTDNPTTPPTYEPTKTPTTDPTNAPSNAPSSSPTRYPTVYPVYNGYIQTQYSLHNLSTANKLFIWNKVESAVPEMTEILERGYLERSNGNLEYKDFSLRIESINNVILESLIDTNAAKGSTDLYNALDVFNFFGSPVTLGATIDILSTAASLVTGNSDEQYSSLVLVEFREMFNNSDVEFMVDTSEEDMEIMNKYQAEEPPDDTPLQAAIVIFSIGAITSGAAFIWDKVPMTSSDASGWMSPMILAIHLYDFISDIILCYTISQSVINDRQNLDLYSIMPWLAIGSAATIILPLLLNTLYAMRIRKQKSIIGNPIASAWFAARFAPFVFLSLFCSGTFPVLKLVSSSLFGLKVFSSGLLSSELRELSKIKIRCTIYFENIPQIIIQLIYLESEGVQEVTILAMAASLLSVASTLIIYFGEKDIENEYTVAKYFLRLFTENAVTGLSKEAKKAMGENRKLKKGMVDELTAIVGSGGDKQIEIGSVTVQDDGLAIHVQHLVTADKMEKFKRENDKFNITVDDFMESLYNKKIGKVFDAMWNHFGLNDTAETKSEWTARYQLELEIRTVTDGDSINVPAGSPQWRDTVVSYTGGSAHPTPRNSFLSPSPQSIVEEIQLTDMSTTHGDFGRSDLSPMRRVDDMDPVLTKSISEMTRNEKVALSQLVASQLLATLERDVPTAPASQRLFDAGVLETITSRESD